MKILNDKIEFGKRIIKVHFDYNTYYVIDRLRGSVHDIEVRLETKADAANLRSLINDYLNSKPLLFAHDWTIERALNWIKM